MSISPDIRSRVSALHPDMSIAPSIRSSLLTVDEARQRLSCGYDRHRVDHVRRALGLRVELAYRVDLVAPQLYAGRRFGGDGVYVDDAAAPADETAGHVDGGLDAVAHPAPRVDHLFEVDPQAGVQGLDAVLQGLAADGLLRHSCRGRDDHGSRAILREGLQGADSVLGRVHIGDEPLEGQRLGLREVQDGRLVPGPEQHLLIEAPGVLGTRRNYQDGRLEDAVDLGEGEGGGLRQHLQPGAEPAAAKRRRKAQKFRRALQQRAKYTERHSVPQSLKGEPARGLACWRCYLSTRYGSGEYPQGVEGAGHVRDGPYLRCASCSPRPRRSGAWPPPRIVSS